MPLQKLSGAHLCAYRAAMGKLCLSGHLTPAKPRAMTRMFAEWPAEVAHEAANNG